MPWVRKGFKGGKVYARVDERGDLLVEDGRVEIKFREDDERTYRASAANVYDLGAPPPQSERRDGAERAAVSPRRPPPANVRLADRPRAEAVVIYTDGACTGNPGPAGVGAVLLYRGHRKEISEYLGQGTNNVAELTAVLRALETVKNPALPVDLCIDSEYVIGVLARGWRPKANRALVQALHREMERFRDLRFVKVPGHAGVPENERADALARAAIDRHSRTKL
jgi:ribonuclease HI